MNKYIEVAVSGYEASKAEVLKKLLSRCQAVAEMSLHAYKAGRCADYE